MSAKFGYRYVLAAALSAAAVAVGCNQIAGIDGIDYADDFCKVDADCDDKNPCTEDACGSDSECDHSAAADGLIPDGINANCKVIQCTGGAAEEVDYPDDVDDGDECTEDACGASGASHMITPGAQCHYLTGLGTCDKDGACVAQCGFTKDGVEVTCPASADKCTLSYCDAAKGRCVSEKLDGVPVPGTDPGECGGGFCAGGVTKDTFAAQGAPCVHGSGVAGVCDGEGLCVLCTQDADCNDGVPESECHDWVCAGGVCANATQPDGPLASQVPEDCHVKTCAGGVFSNEVDATDVHDDGNDCTKDECLAGMPVNTALLINTPCGAGGQLFCDGMGVCKGCTMDSQCGGGTDCKVPDCDVANGQCTFINEMIGKLTSAQSGGDCIDNVCDGDGNITQVYQANDPQNDGNDCTVDACQAMNMSQHAPVAAGQACNDLGGVVCDAAAHCVGKPCAAVGECPNGTFCVDGVCCDSACGGTCNACTGAKKGGGPNGLCGAIMAGDPDNDCPGNSTCSMGACTTSPGGAACTTAAECMSGNCVDGRCCNSPCNTTCQSCAIAGSEGVCTPVPNGQIDNNPSGACTGLNSCDGTANGVGACKKNDGQTCAMGAECVHGNCVDGVCCGTASCPTCQTCNGASNKGTCTNLPVNSPDDMCMGTSTCNGSGVCKKLNGQTCSAATECTSNNCVDGVCCGTASCAICQTCNGAMPGTCTNIPVGQPDTNPANACVSPNSCNGGSGAGACKKGGGQTCAMGAECVSGSCVDGVCCGSAMCAVCQTCNGTMNKGTCTNLPSGTDDNNPAGTCTGINSCDGAGACKKDSGQTCTMGAECVSGSCVDGYCCNQACNGACQACSDALTGLGNGVCSNILPNTDPQNECTGAQVCGMMGTCIPGPNGTSCPANGADSSCGSGFCADGFCCNSACNGTCEACAAALSGQSNGTCGYILAGTDPDNECTGMTPNCNGLGMCSP